MRKRLLQSVLTILFLAAVLSFSGLTAAAETLCLPFENACVAENVESGELGQYLKEPLDSFSGRWEMFGDVQNPEKTGSKLLSMLIAEGKDPAEGFMEFQYLESSDLKSAKSLAFGVHINGSAAGSTDPMDEMYTVTVTTVCGGSEYVSRVYLESGRWYLVYSDLPDAAKTEEVESIRIRISYSDAVVVEQVRLTAPSKSSKDMTFVHTFSAENVQAAIGRLGTQSSRLHLYPDSDGAVSVTVDVNLPQYAPTVTEWYLAVEVDEITAGGKLSAGVMYYAGDSVFPQWLDTAPVEILEGKRTYYFPMPVPERTETEEGYTPGTYEIQNLPEPAACRLNFQNVTGEEAFGFLITGIRWVPVSVPAWNEGNLGSMTEGTLRDGQIQWNGKLARQAVIDHIDEEIALMAVPVWDRYNPEAAVEVTSARISNSFSFTLDAEKVKAYAAGWMFYAAIRTEREVQDPAASAVQYLPVSCPKMLSGTSPAPCALSMFGFHAANAVGVYESNVSHVTVDVQLDQLILSSGAGVLCTYGGVSCTLSQAYLSKLDSEILFYSDAGLEVSLRLLSASPYGWSDKTAENYLPPAETETDLYSYAAVVSYLCRRYPAAASITIGKGINCEKYTGLSLEHPERLMEKIAVLAALTYQTARLEIPDIYVVIPFADGHTYASEDALPDHGLVLEPEWTLLLFADAMKDLGNVPWVASWRFEDDSDAADAAALPERWKDMLEQARLPVFGDFLYRWEPEACLMGEPVPYSFAGRYAEVCAVLADENPRAVILSFARIADYVSQAMYADVTVLPDPSDSHYEGRQIQHFDAVLTEGGRTDTYGALLPIWDFSASYSTEGFVAGGGIEEVFTASNPIFDTWTGRIGSRTLRSVLPVSLYEDSMVGNAGGILLRNFDGVRNLSTVDALQFTFTLTVPAGSTVDPTVVFLIGSEDWRGEYHAEGVVSGSVMTAVCDLREYVNADRTEYIGVMLYGETDLVFDLASVYACSLEGTEADLQNAFDPAEAVVKETPYATEIFYILILLAVLSVSVGILLFRRDREEEDEEDGSWK